jgi:hypothetical protein
MTLCIKFWGAIQNVHNDCNIHVIFASSLGTVFEWYDFYLYGSLAPFFAALFFRPATTRPRCSSRFATYAAGFLVRPFGAIVFGRIGDLVGRKYTFLVTILVMGLSTFLVGLLPTLRDHRLAAPILLVDAAPAAGPRARRRIRRRGDLRGRACAHGQARLLHRRFIQTTATLGLFLSLLVIGSAALLRWTPRCSPPGAGAFRSWSLVLLLGSRSGSGCKLNESPVFQKMKDEGKGSKAPLTEASALLEQQVSCCSRCSARPPARAWSGTRASSTRCSSCHHAQGRRLHRLIADRWSLLIGTPFFIVFGWLSDKIGRKKIILAGCLIAALTFFPLFRGSPTTPTRRWKPSIEKNPITVAADQRPATSTSSSTRGRTSRACDRARTS